MRLKNHSQSYLRIREGGGALFAAIPRAEDEDRINAFEGSYTGRPRPEPDLR